MGDKQKQISIMMLPWLAHGHISPFLELAKRLTNRSFQIYFCSTPINLSSIKPKIFPKYSVSIQLIELHLPSSPNLPPQHHTTNSLPPHLIPTLKSSFDMASSNFSSILKTHNPDLLIYDFLQPWAPQLASSLNIPSLNFLPTGAATLSFLTHFFKFPNEQYPFSEISVGWFWREKFAVLLEGSEEGRGDRERFCNCLEQSWGVVLVKTCGEIEGKYVDYLSSLWEKKVLAVGPLVGDCCEEGDEGGEVFDWLNGKEEFSTVFISFGSEYFLSVEEREEIALGLELSMVNFIWVLRFPVGETGPKEALPDGFLQRVGNRGFVIEDWAPQAKILKHRSIGGFVSHCGWSSVMESMMFGVPIIAMPMHLDQPINARVVEEVGVGVEVKRDKEGGIQRKEVAKVIQEVVEGKSKERIRKKAREVSQILSEKGEKEIDEVVNEILKLCVQSESDHFII